MPTILRKRGWTVVIPTADHPPPHVHVQRPGVDVKVHLVGADGLPEVVRIRGAPDHEVWRALAIVYENQQLLLHAWSEYHG